MVARKRKSDKTRSKTKRRGGKSKANDMDDTSYFGSGISDGAIRRLARRGGIKRIASDVYGEMRTIYVKFLDTLVQHSYAYCECAKRKTIMPQDVIYALKRQGRNMYGYVFDDDVTGHLGVTHQD